MEREYCIRCGFRIEERRRKDDHCSSCRTKPAKTVKWGDDVCIPWRGEFDEYDNPLMNSQPYMFGFRVCNHSDCVNPMHIIDFENKLS